MSTRSVGTHQRNHEALWTWTTMIRFVVTESRVKYIFLTNFQVVTDLPASPRTRNASWCYKATPISAYLQRYAVFHVQVVREQPSPRDLVADVAILVHCVQGPLALPGFPDLFQCNAAAPGSTVGRLDVQPVRSARVSNRDVDALVAARLRDGFVRGAGVFRGG